jgi:hypothetical protein
MEPEMDDMDKEKELALFEYMLSQGAMTPEKQALLRQQQQVNALRESSMEMPETRMMGRVAVAPHWAQALGNVAKGISAGYQQQGLDKKYGDMSAASRAGLEGLRSKFFPQKVTTAATPNLDPATMTDEEKLIYGIY